MLFRSRPLLIILEIGLLRFVSLECDRPRFFVEVVYYLREDLDFVFILFGALKHMICSLYCL